MTFHLAQLNDAGWTTAQTVGALALMEYAGVKKFARTLPRAELEAERARVLESISALTAQIQMAESLNKAYSELLSDAPK